MRSWAPVAQKDRQHRQEKRAARRMRKEAYEKRRIQFRSDFLEKRLKLDFAFQVASWVEYFISNRKKLESTISSVIIKEATEALNDTHGLNEVSIRTFNKHFADGRLLIDHFEPSVLDIPCNVPMLVQTGKLGFLRFVRFDAPDEILQGLFDIDDWMLEQNECTGKYRAFETCPISKNFGRGYGCSFPDCVVAVGR